MGALLDQFAASGVRLERCANDKLRAHGALTDALRAAIRAQKPAILGELAASDEPTVAIADGVMRRRECLLDDARRAAAAPTCRSRGSRQPARVTVAIRDVAVGELEITSDRYEAFALLALMQQYGHA